MAEVAEPVVDPDPVPDPVDPDTVNTDTTSTSPFVLPSSIGGKIVRLPVADTHGGKRKVPQKPTSVHPTPGVTTNIVINPIIDPFVSSSNNGKIVSSGRMKNLISELINEIINGGKPKIPKKPTSLRPGLQSESWNPFLDTSLSSPSPRPSGEMTEPDTLYQMPVYIFQTTCDTVDYTAVCVYGLYGRINENPMDLNKVNVMNVMHIYPDGTMEFPEQVVGCIKSLSRSVESNYSATTPTLDDLTPGNTGVWTPQDITWDITVLKPVYVDLSSFDGEFGDWTPWRPWQPWNPGDNSGVRSSSTIDTYYYDNRLYLNNGGEFGLFNFEQGGRSVRNIGDVTDMIERALNGDTSVNIKAITDAINQIINR